MPEIVFISVFFVLVIKVVGIALMVASITSVMFFAFQFAKAPPARMRPVFLAVWGTASILGLASSVWLLELASRALYG